MPTAKKKSSIKNSALKKSTAKKTITMKSASDPLAPARISELLKRLNVAYPSPECALVHKSAWELLVATILSAQCTDVRVNMVTPELFAKYPTPQSLAVV